MWPDNLFHDIGIEDADPDLLFSLLPHSQAAVLRLHYQHGMTLAETGEQLGISEGRARKTLERALARLREALRD